MYGPTLNHVSSTRIKRTHNQKLNKYLEQIMKTDLQKTTNRNLYNKRFFREFDVLSHIKPNDFWVILNRRVLDLSNLVKLIDELPSNSKDSAALHQLSMFGGIDVSKLFLERLRNKLEMFELKSYTEYGKLNDLFWWNDPMYIVGSITARERHICVRNKAKGTQLYLAVCEEDSVYSIRDKFYAAYSESNAEYIIWRKSESTCCPASYLFLDRTLTENGLEWSPKDDIAFLWTFHRDEFKMALKLFQKSLKNSE